MGFVRFFRNGFIFLGLAKGLLEFREKDGDGIQEAAARADKTFGF